LLGFSFLYIRHYVLHVLIMGGLFWEFGFQVGYGVRGMGLAFRGDERPAWTLSASGDGSLDLSEG
jgi:hypothetical protein